MTKSSYIEGMSRTLNGIHETHTTDKILWFCFTLWLIIDTITGYALNSNINTPLSQVFKTGILLLLIGRLINVKRYLLISLIFILYGGILFLTAGIYGKDGTNSFLTLTKLISTIYLYFYFCLCVKIFKTDYLSKAYKILKLSFIVVAINIGVGLFGLGFHTYPSEDVGYKGFFFAGNELGGVFAAVIPFMLYVIYLNYSLKVYFIISCLIVALSITLGTKSVMLICILSIFFIPFLLSKKNQRMKIILWGCLILVPLLFYLINKLMDSEAGLIIKLMYSYDKKGLEGLIFSGRNEFLLERSTTFFNGGLWIKIFGLLENITVEMDPFDTLLNFGYFGLTINLFLYVYLLWVAYRKRKNNSYMPILIFQNWLLIIMSVVAGHILYSSMAGLFIAIINSFVYIKSPSRCLIEIRKF